MKTIKQFPTLYSVDSKGTRVKCWTVAVHQAEDGTASLVRTHGFIGKKITTSEKAITKGKNIGRSNETTPISQALADATSMQQKQLDKGHTLEFPDLSTYAPPEFPMLAQKFTERKHYIEYPCYVQPKFDGVRCFAKKISETEVTYASRRNKKYKTLEHLTLYFLEMLNVGDIVDGEVYIHDVTFQGIIRRVKKLRPESIELKFHAYDIIRTHNPNMPYSERCEDLSDMLDELYCNHHSYCETITNCPTYRVENEQDIYQYHDKFVKKGFEGVIIRNSDGLYKFNARSNDLQKYKEFIDEEFKIVGAIETDDGNHRGCIKFICETKQGLEFTSYPKGTLDKRRRMFNEKDKYIGKMLTVRYQQLSEEGVPIFNVGIAVRDYE